MHKTSFESQRTFNSLFIAMETLVIACDVLNSSGQHWQRREERESKHAAAIDARRPLSSTADKWRLEIFVCAFFVGFIYFHFHFFVNAFESKDKTSWRAFTYVTSQQAQH